VNTARLLEMRESWVATTYGSGAFRTLLDLVEFAEMAQRLVARGRGNYDRDETVRLACEAVIHREGEAVARLPDGFVDDFPELRLKAFKGMRNVVAHRYHDVDYEILWQTVAVDIPRLTAQVAGVLNRC
jgi:uncharacterized protein with HEPN domain